jgi:hypothetical protein
VVRGASTTTTYSFIAVGGFLCYETTYETFLILFHLFEGISK